MILGPIETKWPWIASGRAMRATQNEVCSIRLTMSKDWVNPAQSIINVILAGSDRSRARKGISTPDKQVHPPIKMTDTIVRAHHQTILHQCLLIGQTRRTKQLKVKMIQKRPGWIPFS